MHRLDTISFLATASISYAGSLFKYFLLLPLIFFTLFFCITMLLTGKYIIAIIDVKCVNNCTKKFRPQMYIRVAAEPQDIMLLSRPLWLVCSVALVSIDHHAPLSPSLPSITLQHRIKTLRHVITNLVPRMYNK